MSLNILHNALQEYNLKSPEFEVRYIWFKIPVILNMHLLQDETPFTLFNYDIFFIYKTDNSNNNIDLDHQVALPIQYAYAVLGSPKYLLPMLVRGLFPTY